MPKPNLDESRVGTVSLNAKYETCQKHHLVTNRRPSAAVYYFNSITFNNTSRMKLLVGLVLALLALFAFAERTSVALAPQDWSTVSYVSEVTLVATKKDLLVYLDQSATNAVPVKKRGSPINSSAVMAVRRRNAEGAYVPVGNFTEGVSIFAETNGKWVALLAMNGGSTVGFFKVDQNNNFSDLSTIAASVANGFLLSDDTYVGYDSVSPLDDGNYTIRTYEYEASNNTWQEIPEAGLVVAFQVNGQPGISPLRVTDTHLVILDPTNSSSLVVNIYERQADKSWKFVESVPVNNTASFVNYNDVDTLTVWSGTPDESGAIGTLFIYTKSNGKWTEQKFTTSSTGYRPIGYFGVITSFLNADNLLANVPFEGWSFNGNPPNDLGKVLLLTRNDDGAWEPAAELTGGKIFGTGIGVNDYDVVIPGFSVVDSSFTFYTAPICFYEPINVTCNNQQVNDCSQVDLTSLYTVNNPQCGAVTATLGGFGLIDNKALQAQFSFTKGFGASYSCNATVSCPVPPITVQQTPSKVSSSVVGVQFGLVSLFGFVSFLLM